MMLRRLLILACAKAGSCALGRFSVGYTMSISGHLRALTEFLRTTGMQCVQLSSATNAPLTDDHVRSRSESEDVTRFTFLEFGAADFVYCHFQIILGEAQFKR